MFYAIIIVMKQSDCLRMMNIKKSLWSLKFKHHQKWILKMFEDNYSEVMCCNVVFTCKQWFNTDIYIKYIRWLYYIKIPL